MLRNQRETTLGVWIDVPSGQTGLRSKSSVALVVDTSGSMGGEKIEHARAAARRLVDSLPDGDILSIHSFSDEASVRFVTSVLTPHTRMEAHSAIRSLGAAGGTNLFDGLRTGELHVAASPTTHSVRRVIVVSDGVATVGPTSTDVLGSIAEKGADHGIQVTAIGVGLDYDERTLNALAVRSSGRLHHIESPDDMTAVLAEESRLFNSTRATDVVVEIVPAPGVSLVSVAGARTMPAGTSGLRIPLGSMFSGQHREMAVKVRIDEPSVVGSQPLASVRLFFKDAAEQGLSRVQEVVARYEVTDQPGVVAKHENDRAKTIAAVHEAAEVAIAAAQDVSAGRFDAAEDTFARAQEKLAAVAANVRDAKEKERVLTVAKRMESARQSSRAAASAPPAAAPAARRSKALDINSAFMHESGY
ncbi:MAG: VWA domain-containing protein [Polyangiaceae bacterium]|nr:VWA domain-containing protein [Polyangiaceae bacterium]